MKMALLLICIALVSTLPVKATLAASDAIYVVAYVDVVTSASAQTTRALKRYRDQSRREPGALSADIFVQSMRPGGFAILEVWQDKAGWETHTKSVSTEQMKKELTPFQLAPRDVHLHADYFGGSSVKNIPGSLTSFVHVDVIPTYNDEYIRFLKAYIDGTQTNDGLVGFAVLQGLAPRTNHFTVIEEWKNQKALEAHQRSEVAQSYRTSIAPQLGALYDERVYRKIN